MSNTDVGQRVLNLLKEIFVICEFYRTIVKIDIILQVIFFERGIS